MKKIIIISLTAVVLILIVSGSYISWNRANPDYTCAKCHEIAPSHERWKTSAHANIHCIECHGSALSEGFNSLSEKTNMVFTHFTKDKANYDIRLNEKQVLGLHNRCISCHQAEHAGWLASGHAVNYKEIFMDSVHNAKEKPYWDCLRCHGMFYDGNIQDLMELEGIASTEWKIRDKKQEMLPAIPCLACHQMHTDNPVSQRYVPIADSSRTEVSRNSRTALYMRADRFHLLSDRLPRPEMYDGDTIVEYASDPNTLLCMQCHAPNSRHQVGSEDDCTVTGVHRGISCIACHRPHSGTTRESCIQCHPSLTEEQIKEVYKQPHKYSVK